MEFLHSYITNNRSQFNIPEENAIAIELHSPWRMSRTSRCLYIVRYKHSSQPLLAIQDSVSLNGIPCHQNPYKPPFGHLVDALLPLYRGEFDVDGRRFFWAEYIPGECLLNTIKRNKDQTDKWLKLGNAAHQIGQMQMHNTLQSSDYFFEIMDKILQKISDGQLSDLFSKAALCFKGLLDHSCEILCSWSHGDLWAKDIIIEENVCKIIDWEWAVNTAPVGADLIDLYITSAEQIFELPTQQAWLCFFQNNIPALKLLAEEITHLWSSGGLSAEDGKKVVVYALLRAAGRVIAQDGYEGTDNLNQYQNLAESLVTNESPFFYAHGNNNSIDNVNVLAGMKTDNSNCSESKKAFLDILRHNPDNISALNHLALIEFNEKEFNSAIEFVKHVLILDPSNSVANSTLSLIQNNLNASQQAT